MGTGFEHSRCELRNSPGGPLGLKGDLSIQKLLFFLLFFIFLQRDAAERGLRLQCVLVWLSRKSKKEGDLSVRPRGVCYTPLIL